MTVPELGRLPAVEMEQEVKFDAPNKTVMAILTKQDEIIAKLNAILSAIETGTDGNSLFTALDTSAIKAQLTNISLML